MGNRCGKSKAVHPLKLKQESDELGRLIEGSSNNNMKIKVRLSKSQLNELMSKMELSSREDSELGRLILQECLEGNLTARVVATESALKRSLSIEDGKTFKKPRRPYEKEHLDAELRLVGDYGLRCKRELWRVQYALSQIRNAARDLLTLDEKNPRRIFECDALLRRMHWYGFLEESQNKLDYVLALTVENFPERCLQTLVFKSGMAKSIHHARVLITQRHIRVGRQVVNIPSFIVRVDSHKHIEFSLTSPFGGECPGRVNRSSMKAAAKKATGGDGDEEDEE